MDDVEKGKQLFDEVCEIIGEEDSRDYKNYFMKHSRLAANLVTMLLSSCEKYHLRPSLVILQLLLDIKEAIKGVDSLPPEEANELKTEDQIIKAIYDGISDIQKTTQAIHNESVENMLSTAKNISVVKGAS